METRNDLREGLLSRLPRPENLASYREETVALLTKHARALRWARLEGVIFYWLAVAFVMLWLQSHWHLDAGVLLRVQIISAVTMLCAGVASVHYKVYSSQVATLKEIKQVQLQLLEVQAKLENKDAPNR